MFKNRVFIAFLISVFLIGLTGACATPASPSSGSERSAKSEAILNLTGVDTQKWPQEVQNFVATNNATFRTDENVVIVDESNAAAVTAALSQFAPVEILQLVPTAGMAFIVYKLNVSPEEETMVQNALVLYHNFMWTSINNWLNQRSAMAATVPPGFTGGEVQDLLKAAEAYNAYMATKSEVCREYIHQYLPYHLNTNYIMKPPTLDQNNFFFVLSKLKESCGDPNEVASEFTKAFSKLKELFRRFPALADWVMSVLIH